jgi:hypothetical protein
MSTWLKKEIEWKQEALTKARNNKLGIHRCRSLSGLQYWSDAMAKCPLCNSRKGKRKCLATNGFVCSVCCGESRNAERCVGCSFFKDDRLSRNYSKTPYIPLQAMADNPDLQDYANEIESAICRFDLDHHEDVADKQVLRLLELLLDKYFFGDPAFNFDNKLEEKGFELIDEAIRDGLRGLSDHEVSKIIGTIYRSIKRRTNGNREYMEFITQHVGARVGKGIRALPFPLATK